jgi:ubiquinone/menaquinone biosynthesis C-methylase UbiE
VANLRRFLREKAAARRLGNVYPVDGLITHLPFPDGFADVTMGGHVFGDAPEEEVVEMERVTRTGGQVIFMPGSNAEREDEAHAVLVAHGYRWAVFEEPEDGKKRKYWKTHAGT